MGKQHPLDVFRTSESGFTKATQRRRRVQGKVLATTAHPAPNPAERSRGPGLLGGIDGGDAVVVRRLAYGALGLLLVAGLLWGLDWFTSPGSAPQLQKSTYAEALGGDGEREAAGAESVVSAWTIQAATYNGSMNGRAMAEAARDELFQRGWADVHVLGFPSDENPQIMLRYELVVGVGRSEQALVQDLAALRAISDWSGGTPSPFLDASIQPHPLGDDI